QNLLDMMVKYNVRKFIFSSTAAIFGEPQYTPIDEDHPKQPINPDGRSTWMVEQILEDYDRAYGLKSICLRYFNACGADSDGELGERHDPETHLIPLVLQTALGKRSAITVFGHDYNTPDGTCIRDYIHVMDLAQAHWLAILHLNSYNKSQRLNLGNGKGFSVQEVIDVCKRITGKNINVLHGARREGDPAILVSDSEKARFVLKWEAEFTSLESIVNHAWQWELKEMS
ncbi:MAG: UDP-glucose 4-epimerase GalE, partial [Ghiorsea sp.]|nr:UDP-glucose 4-epimerase GalE [Ghiorsea sp.]